MPAPSIQSQSADATGTADATGCTVSVPSGTQDGDLLYAMVAACRVAGSSVTITPPAGWTLVDTAEVTEGGSRRINHRTYRRIASSEPASYTWTGDGSSTNSLIGKMFRITGHHPTTPINGSDDNLGTGTSVSGGPVTTTVNDCLLIASAATAHNNTFTFTPPSGMSEEFDFGYDPGAATSMTGATVTQAVAGSTGVKAFTISGSPDSSGGILVAIAPDPGSTDVNQVVETSTAQALTAVKTEPVGQATQAHTAHSITHGNIGVVDTAFEVSEALGVHAHRVLLAVEMSEAQEVSDAKTGLIEQVEGTTDAQAITAVLTTGEASVEGSLDSPGTIDFAFYQNAHFERFVTCWEPTEDGLTAINLQGYTARMQVRSAPESDEVLAELSTANGRLLIDSYNRIRMTLTAAETAEMTPWDTPAHYDLKVSGPGGSYLVLTGRARFVRTATR